MKPQLIIAEADECLADDCRHFFLTRGFDAATVGGGVQCLDMLQQYPPHALILEYELPWGGGDGVLARMREDSHLSSIPVIVITDGTSVHVNGSARQTFGGAPVVACFHKPFRMESLRSTLSVEIPELATEQFLERTEYLLPLVREEFDACLSVH